ncbi:MAG: hypothetical protein L6406_09395 [Desulfobacterales bacterium]|nr:hypothetical protein [Desulfobacterales bacterium]
MTDLTDFAKIFDWVNAKNPINWSDRANWTVRKEKRLDGIWLKKWVNKMTESVNKIEHNFRSNTAIISKHRTEALKSITKSSQLVLMGHVSKPVGKFLKACKNKEIKLPSTISKVSAEKEPCGNEVSEINVGPEWIRHFHSVLYEPGFYRRRKPKKTVDYFPFTNQDHLVHSIVAALLGRAILEAPIDDDANRAVRDQLKLKTGEWFKVDTVHELIAQVYNKQFSSASNDKSESTFETWLKEYWPAVALWHDSGYDTATWCLLTLREFSHCNSLYNLVTENYIVKGTFKELRKALKKELYPSVLSALTNTKKLDGYEYLWWADGCYDNNPATRPWGRFHALFSAYEFLKLHSNNGKLDKIDSLTKHLAAAIAEHHEQKIYTDIANKGQTDDDLAKLLIRNPLGTFLSFVDDLSGFERVDIEEGSNRTWTDTPKKFGKITFSINFNVKPLRIRQPKRGENKRLRFYRCGWKGEQNMKVKKRSLWGDIFEEPGANAPPSCNKDCPLNQ